MERKKIPGKVYASEGAEGFLRGSYVKYVRDVETKLKMIHFDELLRQNPSYHRNEIPLKPELVLNIWLHNDHQLNSFLPLGWCSVAVEWRGILPMSTLWRTHRFFLFFFLKPVKICIKSENVFGLWCRKYSVREMYFKLCVVRPSTHKTV